jgi:hypothetical protein
VNFRFVLLISHNKQSTHVLKRVPNVHGSMDPDKEVSILLLRQRRPDLCLCDISLPHPFLRVERVRNFLFSNPKATHINVTLDHNIVNGTVEPL